MNKIAKIALALVFGAMSFGAFAQETTSKPNVFIDYFWRPTDLSSNTAEELRNYVIEEINKTGRVELIDVDSNSALKLEQGRRNEGVSEGNDLERVAVMKQEGANALIQGRITSLTITKYTSKEGKVSYKAVINYTVKAINPNDGKLLASKTIKCGDGLLDLISGDTPEEATSKVLKAARRGVRSFIEEAFPVYGKVLEIGELKKDEAKTIYISVGSDAGVVKGNKFAICVERKIGGRVAQSVIGECEVKSVEGGDISLAEVKKGGKELKAALDAEQDVVLKSIPKKEGYVPKFG